MFILRLVVVVHSVTSIALIVATLCACGCTTTTDRPISISLSKDQPHVLLVTGLDARDLDSFSHLDPDRQHATLRIRVADAPSDAPSLGGQFTRNDDHLIFTPRHRFQPGLKYRAHFDPTALGNKNLHFITEFELPSPPPQPRAHVTAIYPSADVLPENLLKFYIHFSAPMSRGEAYRHLRLLNGAGEPVPWPFLELGEELWNPEMTRFTLFFEPGRIKQGLVPRLEMGPALATGGTYALIVDETWHDATNRSLSQSAKKTFRVGPADTEQPNPTRWRITPPHVGTSQPLSITFEESLDHAMLQRVLAIRDSAGRHISGNISIADHDRRWSFTPESPWQPGPHVLAVETILEDAAGNSIARPFEVDLNQSSLPAVAPAIIEVRFDVTE